MRLSLSGPCSCAAGEVQSDKTSSIYPAREKIVGFVTRGAQRVHNEVRTISSLSSGSSSKRSFFTSVSRLSGSLSFSAARTRLPDEHTPRPGFYCALPVTARAGEEQTYNTPSVYPHTQKLWGLSLALLSKQGRFKSSGSSHSPYSLLRIRTPVGTGSDSLFAANPLPRRRLGRRLAVAEAGWIRGGALSTRACCVGVGLVGAPCNLVATFHCGACHREYSCEWIVQAMRMCRCEWRCIRMCKNIGSPEPLTSL